jgi:hypothetical protein
MAPPRATHRGLRVGRKLNVLSVEAVHSTRLGLKELYGTYRRKLPWYPTVPVPLVFRQNAHKPARVYVLFPKVLHTSCQDTTRFKYFIPQLFLVTSFNYLLSAHKPQSRTPPHMTPVMTTVQAGYGKC